MTYHLRVKAPISDYGIKAGTIITLDYVTAVDALFDYWRGYLRVVEPEYFVLTNSMEAWPLDELDLLEVPDDDE